MRLASGQLDRRIRIEKPNDLTGATAVDSFGEREAGFDLVAEIWAQEVPFGGEAGESLNVDRAEVRTRWRVRFREDVKPGWRIVHKDRIMPVDFAQEDRRFTRREATLITVREVFP